MTGSESKTENSRIGWVFLDRDGTLNVKPPTGEYIERPSELALLPGAGKAVRLLNQAGVWTGVVTNQRGVSLGRMTDHDLRAVHERLRQLLRAERASLDAIYSCTHDIGVCTCRKPQGGMLLRAKRDQPALDFNRAAIVGDSLSDVEAGTRLGLKTVLLCADDCEDEAIAIADYAVADLLEAARLLVGTRTSS